MRTVYSRQKSNNRHIKPLMSWPATPAVPCPMSQPILALLTFRPTLITNHRL